MAPNSSPSVAANNQNTGLAGNDVALINDVSDVARIFDDGCRVVVLSRDMADEVSDAAKSFVGTGFNLKVAVKSGVASLHGADARLDKAVALRSDIEEWVELMSELTGAPEIGVRLVEMGHSMCPRFHTDQVTVRLICTYDGPASEYLAESDVDRSRLPSHAAADDDEADALILREGGAIRRAQRGDIVLVKGESWPDREPLGAVHRSPAQARDERRLVLTLDPLA